MRPPCVYGIARRAAKRTRCGLGSSGARSATRAHQQGGRPMAHRETPAGPLQGFGEPPAGPGQAGPGGPHSGEPAQPVTPGCGQPGYAWPGYMAPGYAAGTYGRPPPTYLIWAIVATVGGVLFNLILGVPFGPIAIRHAREVRR